MTTHRRPVPVEHDAPGAFHIASAQTRTQAHTQAQQQTHV